MSVLPFFGKNRFEKHKTGLFDDLRSTIFENTNFTEQIQQVFFLLLFWGGFFGLSIPAV